MGIEVFPEATRVQRRENGNRTWKYPLSNKSQLDEDALKWEDLPHFTKEFGWLLSTTCTIGSSSRSDFVISRRLIRSHNSSFEILTSLISSKVASSLPLSVLKAESIFSRTASLLMIPWRRRTKQELNMSDETSLKKITEVNMKLNNVPPDYSPNRMTSAFDQVTIFTSFPSPSAAVHIVRRRSVEAVNSAWRKRMFFVIFKQLFSIFVENR